jgi:predicted DNA binding CopG/RHH family protein
MVGKKKIKYLKSVDEIPEFKNEKQEAKFWNTHSPIKILGQLKESKLQTAGKLKKDIQTQKERRKLLSLRLDPRQIKAAKAIAERKSVGYQTLMRMWISEGITRELKKAR